MSWKGLFISEPARLSMQRGQLLLEQAAQKHSIPLEDLAFIVLDSPQITMTAALFAACAGNGCLIISTDNRHMPNGSLLSFHRFHRQMETMELQISLSEPRKKRLWQTLICQKITNQASCLHLLGFGEQKQKLMNLVGKVGSGDPANTEGLAARLYWGSIGSGFKRDSEGEDRLNILLNYGYGLLRSVLSQALAAHGWLPCLGIHHHNRQNAFNLADDLIEPWRPFVDLQAIRLWQNTLDQTEFNKNDRQQMSEVLYMRVNLEGEDHILLSAMRYYAEQLFPYFKNREKSFLCPSFSLSAGSSKNEL